MFPLLPVLYFNSIKVRLKLYKGEFNRQGMKDFNSIKVRLKQGMTQQDLAALDDFNSIKVRLKPVEEFEAKTDLSYFNSIKVRLKHPTGCKPCRDNLFQFHKGTIKTASQGAARRRCRISIP